jgi:hypothetical protein
MKNLWRILPLLGLFAAALAFPLGPVEQVSAFAGGTGASGSPYQISTCAELLKIDDTTANLSKAYEFSNNVDCSATSVVPLANGSTYFSGVLNGNNFSLTGLNITCTTGFYCALFLAVSGTPEIKNLTVVSPSIDSTGNTSNMITAALVAYSGTTSNPAFSKITISGGLIDAGVRKTTGTFAAGSIAGSIYRGTVTGSTSSATVRGSRYVGGLVGLLGDQNTSCSAGSPSLSGSSYSGNVSGSSYVGGLVGEFGPNSGKNICEIRNSFNSGTVTGTVGGTDTSCSIIGGIVGQLWEATVEDSYNTGEINGATNTCDDVGGIVGWARGNSLSNAAFESPTLQRLYSTGSVSGRIKIGGIAGQCDRGELLVSHSSGAITATGSYAGGLAGDSSCLVSDSYSRSSVNVSSYAGGLIGVMSYYGVSRSYSTSASLGLVGFVSSPSASCTGAFWDKTLGSATSLCGASGKTTTEMKTVSTFTASSWNFTAGSAVWTIDPAVNGGYPFHSSAGVDISEPTLTSGALDANGTSLVLTFSESLHATTAAASAFTVTASAVLLTPTSAVVSGSTVTLTLPSVIRPSANVTIAYVAPASNAATSNTAVQDLSGNDALSFAGRSVTNNSTADLIAPTASWTEPATPSSSRTLIYTLTFSEVVSSIAAGDFSLTGTATGCAATPAASTANLAVSISVTCASDGTVILRLSSNSVTDGSSNTGPPAAVTAATVTINSPVNPTTTVTTAPSATGATTPASVTSTTVATGQRSITTVTTVAGNKNTSTINGVGAADVTTTTTAPTVTTTTIAKLSTVKVPRTEVGGSSLLIDGKVIEGVITREDNRLTVTAGPLVVRIWAIAADGGKLPLDADGRLRVQAGDSVTVDATGFSANTRVEVRLYSDPVLLGLTDVDTNGVMDASYEIPEGIPSGNHNVVLIGERNGDSVTMALSVTLGEESNSNALTMALLGILIIAGVTALMLPAFLRRRRKDEEEDK